jgi:hypothetical protein
MQGSTVMRQSRADTLVTEEPDAFIAHVRGCGRAGWVTTGSTRHHQSRSCVCPQKKRHDQLIQWAMPQPMRALGFGDEVWRSRLGRSTGDAWPASLAHHDKR